MEIVNMTLKDMMILPPAPSKCQACAVDHEPEMPHNQQSLFYQMKFHQQNGRFPTWHDAMEHCTPEMKAVWVKGLQEKGVKL